MMTETFKNMDSSFLKSMMKSQTGVEMSDAEINNIRNMMTPEMIQMMSNMNLDQLNLPNKNAGMGGDLAGSTSSTTEATNVTSTGVAGMGAGLGGLGAQPSISSLLQNQG